MVEIVEEVKAGYTDWKKWLPAGAYFVIIHKTGAGVEAWLEERGVPADWVPPLTSILYAGAAYAGAAIAPEDYKEYLRNAGHGAMALAVLKTVLVFWPGSEERTPETEITRKE